MPSRRKRMSRPVLWWIVLLLVCAMLIVLEYIPLPYYVYAPGTVVPLSPIVTVKGGHKTEKGEFMLTTVYVIDAKNIYDLLYALTLPDHQILPQSEVSANYSYQEYLMLEDQMMISSHDDAQIAALSVLHLPYHVVFTGYQVFSVDKNSKARHLLQPGDTLLSIDGHSLTSVVALGDFLQKAHVGQRVTVKVLRGEKPITLSFSLISLPTNPAQAGIGVNVVATIKVITPYKTTVDTGSINGPSAGLMLSLEMVNQLEKKVDLTRGYRIAGTGTISPDGIVGQIGGISHKVYAANLAHVNYFFVPKDMVKGDTNEAHAMLALRQLHTAMKIVPVHTLAQAIAFLKKLSPR